MKQRTPMKPGKGFGPRTSTLKQKAPLRSTKPMPRSTLLISGEQGKGGLRAKPKRGPGLKGRTPTAAEQRFMDQAGQVPCMACTKDGRHNPHISLHHVQGRTAPGAHFKVLPLCAPHHQPDKSDPLQRIALHDAKATFTARYGSEAELLAELYQMLDFTPAPSL